MWPFRKPLATQIFDAIYRMASLLSQKLDTGKDSGILTPNEHVVLTVPTLGASVLARTLLTDEGAPLRGLRRADLSKDTDPPAGYFVLLKFLFISLKTIMENEPETTAAFGTPYVELRRKFCGVTELPEKMPIVDDEDSPLWDRTKMTGDYLLDTLRHETIAILDFLKTVSERPPSQLPADLYVMVFMEKVSEIADVFTRALSVDRIATLRRLIDSHRQFYYSYDPRITDKEYDDLKDELRRLEHR